MRIGIDLGGTKIEAIALDENGATLLRRRVPTPTGDYGGTLNAIADLVRSFRDFSAIMERGVNPTDPLRSLGWWRVLEYLALAESRLKEAFICGDRSPASIRQYAKFKSKMLEGKRYRPDA